MQIAETKPQPLTVSQKARFRKLDKAVRAGMGAFVVVGMCLKEIRDKKLYREKFETFEDYVRDRHDLAQSRTYQLMEAAETVHQIESSTNCGTLPANEGQVRPLTQLPLDQRASAWEAVIDRAEERGERITAKLVESVVASAAPHARRPAYERITVEHLDKRIAKLQESFKSLPSRDLKEKFVEKLDGLVQEMKEWLNW
jgi:Zn-dependent oligopeptidase